jgi:mannose-6-phosphate isomerase-like protein (cupin superfamily)
MSTTDAPRAHIPAEGGERLAFLGMELILKVTSAMSAGTLFSAVQMGPPGSGVPLHVHHDDDEFFFLIEGELRMLVGDERFDMTVGDTVMLPKGTPHAFSIVGERPARFLVTLDLSPASDYETMFAGLVGLAPTDFDRIVEVCAANNTEFMSPPVMA